MTLAPDTPLIITSDVHVGSPYFRHQAFSDFLERLPDHAALVLNGDTIDNPAEPLSDPHHAALAKLDDEASRRRVIIVQGNHDHGCCTRLIPSAETTSELLVPKRLVAIHGHQIDAVMPAHRWFIRIFRRFHALRVLLGAPDVHVAEYAKRWRLAYLVLVRRQRRNGIDYARRHGVGTIVCGHVHAPEDGTHDGIRYINTGAWTEPETYCVQVLPDRIDYLDCSHLHA